MEAQGSNADTHRLRLRRDTRTGDRLRRYETVDEQAIQVMVHTFYGCIREHPRLGLIFNGRLHGKWEEHLPKMEAFWQSVLLKNGAYKGKPVPAHLKLKEVVSSDYGEWLSVFRPVVRELFVPELADEIVAVAERIAQSLWLATFGHAGSSPPPELRAFSDQFGSFDRGPFSRWRGGSPAVVLPTTRVNQRRQSGKGPGQS